MCKKTWISPGAILAAVVAATSLSVYAVDQSIWMAQGEPTKTLIEQNIVEATNDKFCNNYTQYEIEYQTILGFRQFSKRVPVSACWYQTSYGLIGYNAANSRVYVRVDARGDAVVRLTDNTYGMPLGKTNGMAFTYYMNSYSKSLYIYDDIKSRLSITQTGTYDQYALDRVSNPWSLKYANGSLVGVNANTSSQNGEWMVVEGGGGFMRINTSTKEVLMFDKSMFGYGYGADPSHELAITNDGRYAIVGGGAYTSKIAWVYDLSTCQPLADPFAVAPGCGKRNFKEDFFPGLPVNQAPFRFIFSGDSESVIVNLLNANGKHDKYMVTAPGKSEHLLEYLALGDSYTSGEGEYDGATYYVKGSDGDGAGLSAWSAGLDNFPYELEKCHLGTRSYPYLLASNVMAGSGFRSIACSGSKSNDIQNITTSNDAITRYNGRFEQFQSYSNISAIDMAKQTAVKNFIPGRAAQIEFISRYKPKVATIGIGGNDIKFSDKLVACLMPGTCSYQGDLRSSFGKEIEGLYGKLVNTYRTLDKAGPTTRFYVVGYPQIVSTDESCGFNVRLNFEERVMARNAIGYLNMVIKSAAETVGFTYLDVENALGGMQLCEDSAEALGVQGLASGDDKQLVYEAGSVRVYVYVGNESFHPTHLGHERIASIITAQLGGQSIIDYRKCPILDGLRCPSGNNEAPQMPAYFTAYGTTGAKYVADPKMYESVYQVNNINAFKQGQSIAPKQPVTDSRDQLHLAPNQSNTVIMHSTPRQVGTISTDANGNVSGSITIPEDAEPGYHTLVINMKDSLYQDVTLYQQIFVYASLDDFDGDGVLNTNEACGMVDPVGQDQDRDGTDDACDGIIDLKPDTTPPIVTASLSKQPNDKGWHREDVIITWSVSDDVDTELVAPAATVVDREGEHRYASDEVCDAAGNCARGSFVIKLDKTSPVVTPGTSEAPNQNGWFNRNTTIKWSASDNLSNVPNPGDTTVVVEGENVYTSDVVCDFAGNCSQGSTSIKLDKTAPVIGQLIFSKNPKSVGESSQLSAVVSDNVSGIESAEYFIGIDPGVGNSADMWTDQNTAATTLGVDFGTGVYKLSARTQDAAGNWSSASSDYLVVYDANSGVRLRGTRTIDLHSQYNKLPWMSLSTLGKGTFAFSVRYGADGSVTPQSDFQFVYKTGSDCHHATRAIDCHSFELNANKIAWLTTTGTNNEVGIFSGTGGLKIDGVEKHASFTVTARDGERQGLAASDLFELAIHETGSATQPYIVSPTDVQRGNIKIRF